MFEEFFANCKPTDEVKPSKKRVNKNIAAVRSLIDSETEGNTMTKRKLRIKPLIIAAAAVAAMTATLFTVNAALGGNLVKFLFNGEEYSGDTYDYVDKKGVRHMSFDTVVPIDVDSYAVIFDTAEPDREKAVRVLTEESDPEFIEKLRAYKEKNMQILEERDALEESGVPEDELPEIPDIEDYGIVLNDGEICAYELKEIAMGAFTAKGSAEDRFIGVSSSGHINYDTGIQTIHWEIKFDNGN